MFILTTISDLIQILPQDFQKPSEEALEDNINEKYANKVIQKIGLCVCLYDLLEASEGLIGHGTGIVNVNVTFRLVVFRPFKGEVLTGRISSSSELGIRVQVDFFDEIHIPEHLLFNGMKFDQNEQIWIWENEGETYYLDKMEQIRFRVESEEWNDQSPVAPSERGAAAALERKSPYVIRVGDPIQVQHLLVVAHGSKQASMAQSGLGMIDWW
ncbi:MAG: DNA-directed RNA polymerase III subunit rpc25 [Thelocarpon superellum]|nr:MAG: DNA-directed RNA polymerase III subunit rpc25 [Thelocarpon superellum]